MLSGRRRASVLGAAALATVFCVQLFWTHAKLEGVKYLSDQAGASSPQEPGHLLPLYPPLQWLARRPQAAAREAAAQLVVGQRQALENPAVIVFCYNRVGYLNQTLHSLANLTGLERYTVYVSQVRPAGRARCEWQWQCSNLKGQGASPTGQLTWIGCWIEFRSA